jgi:2-oxoglutarate ferredoxin oxidoreductase subunit delta
LLWPSGASEFLNPATEHDEPGAQVNDSVEKLLRKPMDLHRAQVPRGEVHVIAERCKECGMCINYCPTDVLVYTEDINARGYRYPMVADGKDKSCVHCQFCNMICPELAIFTTDVSEKEKGS